MNTVFDIKFYFFVFLHFSAAIVNIESGCGNTVHSDSTADLLALSAALSLLIELFSNWNTFSSFCFSVVFIVDVSERVSSICDF